MKTDAQSLLLLAGGAGFLAYLALKAWSAVWPADAGVRDARKQLSAAKRRARDRTLNAAQRAAALREAATVALQGLHRPNLAATLARRAARLDPANPDSAGLVTVALRSAARYSALERFLWRQLADLEGPAAAGYQRTFDDLVALYDGPLRRPETARVLRRFRSAEA